MAEKDRCEICNRNFKSKDALDMHNSAKHSKTKEKSAGKAIKLKPKKIKKYTIFIAVFVLVVVGFYMLIKSSVPEGEDFSRAVPLLTDRDHILVGSEFAYNSNPPTSGSHYGTPARPGFREIPIEDGYLVHSLEHGLVLVSYHPRIGAEAEKLRDIVNPFMVVVQRGANDADIALAAWGRLDTFNLEEGIIDADDLQRISNFVKRYANKAPERISAGQHGGI